MWKNYIILKNIEELLEKLSIDPDGKKIIAGATDLLLELERGQRSDQLTLLDITKIKDLDRIWEDDKGYIHLGPLVTHNDILAEPLIRAKAYPLLQACWQIGSPQIRNVATVAGNLITASPANDTITPLMALGAILTLKSKRGERQVPLSEFYLGVRKTVIRPDEVCTDIFFKALPNETQGFYIKSALRKAQAISVVNACVIVQLEEGNVAHIAITMGAIAPTIIHAKHAEEFLQGKVLDKDSIRKAIDLVDNDIRPISDLRGSDRYRAYIVKVLIKRCLEAIIRQELLNPAPNSLVLLDEHLENPQGISDWNQGQISATINGEQRVLTEFTGKTLLRVLRDDLSLMGTKEGCAEGECGACTVHMNGKAVMSCLVPAPRANGADITTIEGLSDGDNIHPLQQSFIDEGAVQCGFCTPGFIMSGTMLLKEISNPDEEEIKQAITGNLCRCTGYYKIVKAIENASKLD